jgi:AcrR family transcriptional regulator
MTPGCREVGRTVPNPYINTFQRRLNPISAAYLRTHTPRPHGSTDPSQPAVRNAQLLDRYDRRAYYEHILNIMNNCSKEVLAVPNSREDPVRDLRVNARRGQILEAATRVFAEKGFRRSTTREVARAAGVSEGTIYNYFEDKDALLMAIVDRLNETERRAEDFEEGMATDFPGFFKEYLRRRMFFIWENREVFRVVLSEMLVNAELRETYLGQVVMPTMKIAEENFRLRAQQGEMRATDAPLAVRAVTGAVLGVLVLGLLGDEEIGSRPGEVADVLAGLLIHGLGADERG